MIPLLLIIIAAVSYFLGTLSGSALIARYLLHRDARQYAYVSYTSFARMHGWGWCAAYIGFDVVKSLVAVLLGGLLMLIPGDGFPVIGRLFAGFCTAIGDMWPVQHRLRGGRGVTCMLTALWLADFRVGLLITAVFIAVLAITQYGSAAALASVFAGMIGTWIFVESEQMKGLAGVIVLFAFLLILWRYRGNVAHLIRRDGKEPKVTWGRRPASKLSDDDF